LFWQTEHSLPESLVAHRRFHHSYEQTQRVAFCGDELATLPQWRAKQVLYWAVTFFVVALLAAIMGFTGIAIAAAGIAKILFFVFLILFLVSLVAHMSRRI
jgi:uncharacterized membrane protein YtjA (UPF0391 family)